MIVFAFSLGFFLGREVTLAGGGAQQAMESVSHQNLPSTPSTQSQRERVSQYKKNWLKDSGQTKAPSPNINQRPKPQESLAIKQPLNTQQKPAEPSAEMKQTAQAPKQEEVTGKPKEQNGLSPPVAPRVSTQANLPASSPASAPADSPAGAPANPQADSQAGAPADQQASPPLKAKEEPKASLLTQQKAEELVPKVYVLRIQSHKNREKAMQQSTDLKLQFPAWRFFFKKTGSNYTVYIGPFKLKQSALSILRKLKQKGLAGARIEEL